MPTIKIVNSSNATKGNNLSAEFNILADQLISKPREQLESEISDMLPVPSIVQMHIMHILNQCNALSNRETSKVATIIVSRFRSTEKLKLDGLIVLHWLLSKKYDEKILIAEKKRLQKELVELTNYIKEKTC